METLLKLREVLPLEHFKSIRFTTEYPANLTGHVFYLREDYKGYNVMKGDAIDRAILAAIEAISAKATFMHQTTLLTNEEYQHALHVTKGGANKELTFQFFPEADLETYQQLSRTGQLKAISVLLRATFWTHDQDLVNNVITDPFLARLPLDKMLQLKTLKRA